jgi:hypothetical protein
MARAFMPNYRSSRFALRIHCIKVTRHRKRSIDPVGVCDEEFEIGQIGGHDAGLPLRRAKQDVPLWTDQRVNATGTALRNDIERLERRDVEPDRVVFIHVLHREIEVPQHVAGLAVGPETFRRQRHVNQSP